MTRRMIRRSEIQQARTAPEAVRACPRRSRRGAGSVLALLLWLLLCASPALAGPPSHTHNPALDISGFNHACGAAVDSKGDVYVASAGESKVKVFDPAHTELTSIPNANEPCGLAVDSRGTLFVTEKATGKVVRYVPNAYPFAGTPSYGAAETIDASGNAKGIAIDANVLLTNSKFLIGGDDSLYIAKGDHIDAYANESQGVQVNASGGTFKLTFNGQSTAALPFNATHAEVQAALEALSTVGANNVSVTTGNFQATNHLVVFTHKLGLANVSPIEVDASGLTGGGASHSETNGGLLATIGNSSTLTNATGVAAYTHKAGVNFDRYLFAADAATDQVKVFAGPELTSLKLRRTIDGPKAGEDFGFGTAGAYLAVDPGNRNAESSKCASVAEQACTGGHLLVYDDAHAALDEFEANGEFLDQLKNAAFADAKPTALAIDRSGGSGDGTIYVSAGAASGSKLLAFGPLAAPSRPPLPELSHVLKTAQAVATDSEGNVYAAAGSAIHVYGPDGKEIEVGPNGKGIETAEPPRDIAVDSSGKVYALFTGNGLTNPSEYTVKYYTLGAYPPSAGTQYSGPTTVATGNSFLKPATVTAIGLNPKNGHLFVGAAGGQLIELGSVAEGSPILKPCFGCGLGFAIVEDVAAYGANGDVYVSGGFGTLFVIDPSGTEVLVRITGTGSPQGPFGGFAGQLAVDQSNGHVLAFDSGRGAAEEYDASGAFVAQYGKFTIAGGFSGIAIDNSGGPSDGNVYVAFDDPEPGTFDLTAFGPLAYGEAPLALTGVADGLGSGNATLHGTVDPRGFELEDCHFEYLSDDEYVTNGKTFAGATSQNCAESIAEIGKGSKPVAVHADIGGLDPEGRYRFRLLAENKYGSSEGEAGLFGPPLLTTKAALPVFYDEATLRAEIDPSGLQTKYHFEYGTSEGYGQSTPVAELPPSDGAVAVKAALTGLTEGTKYHFRILVENEAKTVKGPDQTMVTQARRPADTCPNTEFRTGLSANLPECRAYELVTPAETRGSIPLAATNGSAGEGFNNWLVAPRGKEAGESLAYFISGTLPGFEGNGRLDGYRAQRGAGAHPKEGWTNELFGPSYAQTGGESPTQHGVAADQHYSFWEIQPLETLEGTLVAGNYLRTPAGFEALGQGSLGVDPKVEGRYLTAGASHVIFSSKKQLEPEAAPEGIESIYDRSPGAPTHVVSLPPESFSPGEKAEFEAAQDSKLTTSYQGASDDGSTVAFKVGPTLYAREDNSQTEALTRGLAAEVGDALSCAEGPLGVEEGNRHIEWLRNGVLIPGTDSSGSSGTTYTTVPADAGTAIQCQVSVQKEAGSGSVWVSNPAVLVAPVPATEPPEPPEAIAAPTPPGPGAGSVESCDPGTWTGASGPFAYQWYRNGEAIAGASAETYEVKAADVPGAIQCRVTALGAGGAIAKVSAITATNPPPEPAPPLAFASADLETDFAGVSEDGARVFFATVGGGRLFSFDLESQSATEIAQHSTFVNVSPGGSGVLFSSKDALSGGEENEAGEVAEAGERNLYAWDGSTTSFVAILDPEDFESFGGDDNLDLSRWTSGVSAGPNIGRDGSPTRATPDGEAFVFQSHAQLTAYDNGGHGEIYRYEPAAAPGSQLICVSCDPSGAPASGDAMLQSFLVSPSSALTLIPNLTDDGAALFFESPDRLLPEDANGATDVYEWKAQGAGSCKRAGGCMALISSGQGESDSFLYGMSADGHDVFFETREKLVGADILGSTSIYDARTLGGIPDPPAKAPCQGDACQGSGSAPPVLQSPASAALRAGGNTSGEEGKPRCAKGQRKVRRAGKTRCVKKQHKKRHRKHRTNHNRRAER